MERGGRGKPPTSRYACPLGYLELPKGDFVLRARSDITGGKIPSPRPYGERVRVRGGHLRRTFRQLRLTDRAGRGTLISVGDPKAKWVQTGCGMENAAVYPSKPNRGDAEPSEMELSPIVVPNCFGMDIPVSKVAQHSGGTEPTLMLDRIE